jgi:hypothetical protein
LLPGACTVNNMARIQKPPAGRLVVSIIYAYIDAVADALQHLERRYGQVLGETVEIPVSEAAHYREEMGGPLLRRFFSFERPVVRDSLPEVKRWTHKLESQFADCVNDYTFRAVNIDPGVLTPYNLVMAGHREFNHRIYLAEGVFGEIALIYARGQFRRLPWTNPDFCHREAIGLFERTRDSFALIEEPQQI